MLKQTSWIFLLLLFALSSCESTSQNQNDSSQEVTTTSAEGQELSDETLFPDMPEFRGPSLEFRILHMNDAYEISASRSTKLGGLARVASLRKQLLAENPNLITVLPGDFLSPSFIGLQKDENGNKISGKHMVEVLNAVGLDYVTFGNHEFDLSYEELKECMDMSEFEWTSCNVFHRIPMGVTYFTKKKDGKEKNIGRYIVHKFYDEQYGQVRLGLLAATLPFNIREYVNYSTVFLALKSTYEKLYPEADLVALMTHLEKTSDRELARRLPVFPLIMGGHDHQNMIERVGNTIIAKADANANSVYVHTLNYYFETTAVQVKSKLIAIDESIEEDPEVAAIVSKWEEFASERSKASDFDPYEVIFTTDTTFDCREVTVRNRAADIGWLIVSSFMWAMEDADCAILNGGSIRLDDYLEGDIMQQDILAMLPFGGPISMVEMSGQDLQKTLDIGLYVNIGKGGFLQVSNIKKVGQFWVIGDEQLDPEKTYKVVMPKFLADGRETKLKFLSEYSSKTPEYFANGRVKNDVRNIMIEHLKAKISLN